MRTGAGSWRSGIRTHPASGLLVTELASAHRAGRVENCFCPDARLASAREYSEQTETLPRHRRRDIPGIWEHDWSVKFASRSHIAVRTPRPKTNPKAVMSSSHHHRATPMTI